MKYWEIIADNLSKAGWSWGCVSTVDSQRKTIGIADAHRDDGKRYVVREDEKLSAFLELEIRPHRWGWRVFEAPSVEPVFPKKDHAIDYAPNRARLPLW